MKFRYNLDLQFPLKRRLVYEYLDRMSFFLHVYELHLYAMHITYTYQYVFIPLWVVTAKDCDFLFAISGYVDLQ